MRPLSEMPDDVRREIRGVLCDVDDTLTTEGRLRAEAYSAMERLADAGLIVVPITGRPAGWCDHIARFWPVSAVVGENGAFYFRYDRAERRMKRVYAEDAAARARGRERLAAIAREIVVAVPGCAVAADQPWRETDLAIDYCEDVPRLAPGDVDRIVALMQARGLTAKPSSIHVNGWPGTYDKLGMTKRLMREEFGSDLDAERSRYVFAGDSPNDAPLFAHFPHAVGVANIADFAGRLPHEPRYVTQGRGGAGFRELADFLLAART
jgi:HAD superfamily hydrolase (TIGR01484 family)